MGIDETLEVGMIHPRLNSDRPDVMDDNNSLLAVLDDGLGQGITIALGQDVVSVTLHVTDLGETLTGIGIDEGEAKVLLCGRSLDLSGSIVVKDGGQFNLAVLESLGDGLEWVDEVWKLDGTRAPSRSQTLCICR